MRNTDIATYCVTTDKSVRQVIEVIDRNKDGIVLVINDAGSLIGTITDGDIRRFLLANHSVEESCTRVMWAKPITAPITSSTEQLQYLLTEYRLRSIPLIDELGQPKGIVTLQNIFGHAKSESVTAVIMAGGEGTRLRPITESIPKPMVEVGGKPILETIVRNLSQGGITDIRISLNYRGEIIEEYFGDGSKFGCKIKYLKEDKKLGTAGALSLLEDAPKQPFLLMNGDVLTNVQFSRFLDFHRHHRSVLTIAASKYHFRIPYGVMNVAGHFVLGIEEKPTHHFLCNAGMYVINPELLRLIPFNQPFNMTDLLAEVTKEGLPVAAFPLHEYWLDIGQKEDLDRARQEAQTVLGKKE